MKFSEISGLNEKELWLKMSQLKRELFDARIQLKMKRLSNPLSVRFTKRDIARVLTALSALKNKKPEVSKKKPPEVKEK